MNIFNAIYCRTYQMCIRIALPILPYRNPKKLDSMDEIVPLLIKKNKSRVLLIVDSNVRAINLTDSFEKELTNAGIRLAVYEQKTINPTVSEVEDARNLYVKSDAQAIIAVGGGSSIDCAKIVGARIARPGKSIKKMRGLLKIILPTPLMIAVPTTAGTGSEATLAAVITDEVSHYKYPINDFSLIPDYTVFDPQLTVSLPPFITATTGMDALTHAVEAYIGQTTNRFTRTMSEEAVSLIYKNLKEAVKNGTNLNARKNMLYASYCAGLAFTRSYVGYVHGIAHSLGGKYGIAHGYANAVVLPVMLKIYGADCEKKLARLARKCGMVTDNSDDGEAAKGFIFWIEELNREFGISKGFCEIRDEDIGMMAYYADKESNPLYPVPRLMDKSELEEVYKSLAAMEE